MEFVAWGLGFESTTRRDSCDSGEIKLIHAWKDDFEAEEWLTKSIEFYRDNEGNIIGFKATEGGARNQNFKKISN